MNRKKHFLTKSASLALASALLLALPLTSCGAQKETIKLSVWGAEEDQQLLSRIVDEFEAQYQDEAEFEITICAESEMTCKDTVLFEPEIAADVYTFANDQLQSLVDAGALMPVPEEDLERVISDNGGADSGAIEAASADGTVYAYPLTASNGYFLFYDSRYLSADEVTDFTTMLDAAERQGKTVAMDFTSGWYTYSFFKAAGLDVHKNEDGSGDICEWNTTDGKYKGTDVLESMISIADHPAFESLDNDAMVEEAQNGKLAAGISGTWNSTVMQEAFGEGYSATILPHFTCAGDSLQMHSVCGYKLVGMSAYTQEKEWASRLVGWITNEDNQLQRFEERGEGPSNVNAVRSEEVQADQAIAALGEQSEFAHVQDVSDKYWSASFELGTVINAKNPDHLSSQQLLDNMVAAVQ